MTFIFDGQEQAEKIKKPLKKRLSKLAREPVLEVVMVGSDPINEGYLEQLEKCTDELGVKLIVKRFDGQNDPGSKISEVTFFIKDENQNQKINGLLVQVSPSHKFFKKREELVNLVIPKKDADYLGQRFWGDQKHVPSVCQAVLIAIRQAGRVLSFHPQWVGVLVVGNRGFWGRRIEQTLKNIGFEDLRGVDRETKNLTAATCAADILISCVGSPSLIKRAMVKKGAAVIDVGLGCSQSKLVGDVDFDEVKKVAGFITPIPGGLGPLSVVLVFKNFVEMKRRKL